MANGNLASVFVVTLQFPNVPRCNNGGEKSIQRGSRRHFWRGFPLRLLSRDARGSRAVGKTLLAFRLPAARVNVSSQARTAAQQAHGRIWRNIPITLKSSLPPKNSTKQTRQPLHSAAQAKHS